MGWWSTVVEKVRPATAPMLNIAGDVGDGPVIILIHGIASSAATFKRLVPLLSDRYRCISIELLGFGDSPAPARATYTVEEHVAAIHRTIRSLRLKAPFLLMGHSLGSLLSARYTAVHPEHVSRLVLISPPVYLSPAEIGDPRSRRRAGRYLRVYEFMRSNKEFTIGSTERIASFFQLEDVLEVSERNWTPFILSLQNCIESQTTVSDIAAVRVPIDVVYGTLDPFINPDTMGIIEQMRHVTMHRVELNDHLVRKRLATAVATVVT
ncbi:alpha/beta hydrolase [Salinibacterium sp. G-O1]|uniref:alpha/beta fold hydrolase n=1 Tax=Salinibacterium sp. G-O1 TaxID=3046208 RepID=UPI0024B939B9|nr:alpha/beta hydrolase [Salinibacterium sp. G-O1]MDJ0336175.1 alpha/beta hydrolase [Salinibacterium sp. G-O1]